MSDIHCMPGFSLFRFNGPIGIGLTDLSRVFKQNCWLDKYSFAVNQTDKTFYCSLVYPGYHYSSWEDEHFSYHLDGLLFDYPGELTKTFLRKFAHKYFIDKDSAVIREFFKTVDAEFVLAITNLETGDIVLINDVLGRLPIYIYQKENDLIVSRDIPVITSLVNPGLNQQAMADVLFLGYPIGDKTLYENINLLLGGCFIDIEKEKASWKSYNVFDFHEHEETNISYQDAITTAGELFVEAVSKRIGLFNNPVISLSGGLDSRALCGAVNRLGNDCPVYTFLDYKGTASKDLKIAREISSAHHLSQYIKELPEVSFESLKMLFSMKAGMNYLGMGFIIPYLVDTRRRFDGMLTGDGGDKVLPDIRPLKKLKSVNSLLKYIEFYHGINSLKEVAEMTGRSENELRDYYIEYLDGLPPDSPNMKYVYFIIKNRAFRWLFEGEDRNRCFLPSFTPFYAYPLFNYLMALPFSFKENYNFFRDFLIEVSPESVAITNANWGFSLKERKMLDLLFRKQRFKSTFVVSNLYKLIKRKPITTMRLGQVRRKLLDSLLTGTNPEFGVSEGSVKELIKYDDDTIYHLLTFLWSRS